MRNGKNTSMKQWIKDTAGLGTALWFVGYLASLVLFFTPYAGIMGWILLAVFTPFTVAIAWWWFRTREPLDLQYYAGVGVAWMLIAVVLDYLFIVLMFQAAYYKPDVFLYYILTFLIPVGVGLYLIRTRREAPVQE
jgi:hypothetical protein